LLDEVMLLALKFGWSRAEIMALSAAEMRHYIKRLNEVRPA
jgi:hypothetical protein